MSWKSRWRCTDTILGRFHGVLGWILGNKNSVKSAFKVSNTIFTHLLGNAVPRLSFHFDSLPSVERFGSVQHWPRCNAGGQRAIIIKPTSHRSLISSYLIYIVRMCMLSRRLEQLHDRKLLLVLVLLQKLIRLGHKECGVVRLKGGESIIISITFWWPSNLEITVGFSWNSPCCFLMCSCSFADNSLCSTKLYLTTSNGNDCATLGLLRGFTSIGSRFVGNEGSGSGAYSFWLPVKGS